ncbi:hypothetical protein PV10_04969 [Exophiala mesophila]|uniref:Uncharacterized protein n=1 Tax=Exophiala mesophila TaxID=212818 RepID=A0A0D1XZT6_EXOME|nr:uncharacterized protein PV10_04969 [Exophiala mesophila]KIV93781.1 hypothetical protein PV10_04969 [Exophiala mesophila]
MFFSGTSARHVHCCFLEAPTSSSKFLTEDTTLTSLPFQSTFAHFSDLRSIRIYNSFSNMSFVTRTLPPIRVAARSLPSRSATAFHTSSVRKSLSEADRDHPEKAQTIDHHKSDSVEKAKTGKGEWKPELASASEQAISGDKNDMTVEQMQKLGAKKSEEGKSPSGSSSSKGTQ